MGEQLQPHLEMLYDNDHILDQFEIKFSADAKFLLTGSYQSRMHVLDWQPQQREHHSSHALALPACQPTSHDPNVDDAYDSAIRFIDFHPTDNLFAALVDDNVH